MDPDASEEARRRRAAAAQVSRDFALVEDLDTLLSVAEHGFAVLFDGGSTIQLGIGDDARYVSGGRTVTKDVLAEHVVDGLAGHPSPDAVHPRPGILLAPQSATSECRAWVQFAEPRRISADQMIVADLLAQAFAIAVDRVIALEQAARREDQLSHAIVGHQLIGQAVGILVERHRIAPAEAFEKLKTASQNRNIKLREISARVIETGLEPGEA